MSSEAQIQSCPLGEKHRETKETQRIEMQDDLISNEDEAQAAPRIVILWDLLKVSQAICYLATSVGLFHRLQSENSLEKRLHRRR